MAYTNLEISVEIHTVERTAKWDTLWRWLLEPPATVSEHDEGQGDDAPTSEDALDATHTN